MDGRARRRRRRRLPRRLCAYAGPLSSFFPGLPGSARAQVAPHACPPPARPTSLRAAPSEAAPRVPVAVALYDCAADADGDLAFEAGDLIDVLDDSDADWWRGRVAGGAPGTFPANYVRPAA